jgi:hypothetical protein
MTDRKLVRGTQVEMGGEVYTIPPLNFSALQELEDDLGKLHEISGVPTPEQVQRICRIVHAALKRNYPDMTIAEVMDKIDMGNFGATLGAVVRVSGLEREEGAPAGERTPGSP